MGRAERCARVDRRIAPDEWGARSHAAALPLSQGRDVQRVGGHQARRALPLQGSAVPVSFVHARCRFGGPCSVIWMSSTIIHLKPDILPCLPLSSSTTRSLPSPPSPSVR